jgi:PAS domain S-box-containing protein
MKGSPLKAFWRSIASVLLGCIVLTLVIFVCVQLHTRLTIAALLCLLTIVLISLQGRFFVALLCSAPATFYLAYFFMHPVFSLAVTRPEDIAALVTFLTITLVVSALGSKLRQSNRELAQENAERKRAEEQQRYHMQLLKTVTDNASSMLFIVDAAGIGTFVNPAFERITGYCAEEVIGQVIHDKIHHAKPDGTLYSIYDCPLAGAARTGKIMQGEDLFVHKDNTFFPIRYTSSPIFREGISVGTVIEVQDLTESKAAEQAWREVQAQLAHLTRVATLGELAGSIAHEVNQPLGAIANNARAGLRFLESGSENLPDVKAALLDIVKGADRVSSINVRMRALAKKVPPEITELNFADVVTDVLTLIHPELARRQVVTELELSRELPPVLADRVQVQQVLLNLLMNSVEAMNDVVGDRKIWIRAKPYEYNGSPAVLVSVQDSGSGLKQADVDRLFDAFYTTKPQGLGLGLSITRSIIEAHGGRLWARANVPKGALFQFTLPIADK